MLSIVGLELFEAFINLLQGDSLFLINFVINHGSFTSKEPLTLAVRLQNAIKRGCV